MKASVPSFSTAHLTLRRRIAIFSMGVGSVIVINAILDNLSGVTSMSLLLTLLGVIVLSAGLCLLQNTLPVNSSDRTKAELLGTRNHSAQRYLSTLKQNPRGLKGLTNGEYAYLVRLVRSEEAGEAKSRWIN